jgi:NAD(P)-dependent dehydrogenase (short-subunit alcohol dehydrogenase family)
MFRMDGKTVIVTGGAGYLLYPACRGFAELGARVVVGDFNQERLDEAVRELSEDFSPERILGVNFDAADEASCTALVEAAVERFGKIDVLVSGTTGSAGKEVGDIAPDEFDRANRMNITSPFFLARSAVGHMPEQGGSIIFISSMYGLVAPNPSDYYPLGLTPNPVDYGAGKAGLCQLGRYLAAYWGSRNIRVNVVAPGAFPWKSGHGNNDQFINVLGRKSMLGRIGRREEIGGAVVFLATEEASFITGQVLSVDGGVTSW